MLTALCLFRSLGPIHHSHGNQLRGLDSGSFARIELLRPVYHALLDTDGRFGMASETGRSESLAWCERAAQARRVAAMLSPADARLAEVYAAECEARARGLGRSHLAGLQHVVDPVFKSAGKVSPKRAA